MWQELSLVHTTSQKPVEGMAWRTCLRQIQFLPPGAVYGLHVTEGDLYRGTQAHRFLVEICSGLHSPLLGETEVFGQFRAFKELQNWDNAWMPLLDAVEEDVKKLRRTHLVGIGAQSYGSLVRRRIPEGAPVVLVGGGRLAQDLFPWLKNHSVTLLVRNPAKKESWWEKTKVLPLAEAAQTPAHAHWIVAAPLTNEALTALTAGKEIVTLLDFRGETQLEASPAKSYFDLRTLFAELETTRSALAARRAVAMEAAADYSRQREASVYHRPFGWEDAFA